MSRSEALTNDKDIHGKRETNDVHVELDQRIVFFQSGLDEVTTNHTNEIVVEGRIGDEVDDFFAPIPDLVDMNVTLIDLESRGKPNAIDRDVDACDQHGDTDFQIPGSYTIKHEDADPVDDNLEQELNLERP